MTPSSLRKLDLVLGCFHSALRQDLRVLKIAKEEGKDLTGHRRASSGATGLYGPQSGGQRPGKNPARTHH